jgi:hypothetical protein
MSLIASRYEHLLDVLLTFVRITESLRPQGESARNWSEGEAGLKRELELLRLLAPVARSLSLQDEEITSHSGNTGETGLMQALFKGTVMRLTQLARSQDHLSLNHCDNASLEQFHTSRRAVVIAAWHVRQSVEKS